MAELVLCLSSIRLYRTLISQYTYALYPSRGVFCGHLRETHRAILGGPIVFLLDWLEIPHFCVQYRFGGVLKQKPGEWVLKENKSGSTSSVRAACHDFTLLEPEDKRVVTLTKFRVPSQKHYRHCGRIKNKVKGLACVQDLSRVLDHT